MNLFDSQFQLYHHWRPSSKLVAQFFTHTLEKKYTQVNVVAQYSQRSEPMVAQIPTDGSAKSNANLGVRYLLRYQFWAYKWRQIKLYRKGSAGSAGSAIFYTHIRKKKYTRAKGDFSNTRFVVFFSCRRTSLFCATCATYYILVYKWRYYAKNLVAQKVAQR